jgi:hypothetical protein
VSSRYDASPKQTYVSPDGVTVTYKAPRVLPLAAGTSDATTTIGVGEVNRLDLVANRTLRNPLLAWKLADANDAMDPFDLCARAGARIDVPGAGL